MCLSVPDEKRVSSGRGDSSVNHCFARNCPHEQSAANDEEQWTCAYSSGLAGEWDKTRLIDMYVRVYTHKIYTHTHTRACACSSMAYVFASAYRPPSEYPTTISIRVQGAPNGDKVRGRSMSGINRTGDTRLHYDKKKPVRRVETIGQWCRKTDIFIFFFRFQRFMTVYLLFFIIALLENTIQKYSIVQAYILGNGIKVKQYTCIIQCIFIWNW